MIYQSFRLRGPPFEGVAVCGTHRNIEGILLFQKIVLHFLRKTENPY